MILYLDTSAFLKKYFREAGTDEIIARWKDATGIVTSSVAYAEALAMAMPVGLGKTEFICYVGLQGNGLLDCLEGLLHGAILDHQDHIDVRPYVQPIEGYAAHLPHGQNIVQWLKGVFQQLGQVFMQHI